jgi:NAD(P)-dependent dehydrogenase (short-subunit alcohol dehydrogenase family)
VETEIGKAGGNAVYVTVDVTDVDATEQMAATAVERFGGIDILVNNAAMFAGLEAVSLVDLPVDRWDRLMAINVKGVWLCTRAVVPHMKTRGGGVIVNQALGGSTTAPRRPPSSASPSSPPRSSRRTTSG